MFQSTSSTSRGPAAAMRVSASLPFGASTVSKPSSPMMRPIMRRMAFESSTMSARIAVSRPTLVVEPLDETSELAGHGAEGGRLLLAVHRAGGGLLGGLGHPG